MPEPFLIAHNYCLSKPRANANQNCETFRPNLKNNCFFKCTNPVLFFSCIFILFKQTIQCLQQIDVKNVMSIQYMASDLNPQPFEHESSPITTNPNYSCLWCCQLVQFFQMCLGNIQVCVCVVWYKLICKHVDNSNSENENLCVFT